MTATVEVSRLPVDINGEWFYNGISWDQDNVCTDAGIQFAVWWGPDKIARIGRRLLPSGAWDARSLPSSIGFPFGTAPADLHNTLAVAVDSDGFLHMCGNMHNDHLKYARSGSPYDHRAMFAAGGMIGTEEDSVTYPQFVKMPSGKLLFFYRNGSSGNGNVYLNAYDTTTRAWTRRAFLLDGITSDESPYLHRVAVDKGGRLHAFVIWRADLGAASNTDLSYLTSDDEGVTWTKAGGTGYTLPVTHATIEVVVPSGDGSGLLNQCGADGDTLGHPHAAAQYTTSGITQIHHIYWDGAAWHNDQATHFTTGEFSYRPTIACPDDGNTYLLYTGTRSGQPGLWCHDVSGGDTHPHFALALLPDGYEITYDVSAWRNRGELYVLACNAISNGSTSPGWNHVDDWARQWGAVLRFDMDLISDFAAGLVDLPSIVGAGSATGPTASVPISGDGLLYRVTATGASGTVTATESRAGQADVTLTAFTLTGGLKATPWIPLRLTGDGAITLAGAPDGALLEVGSIDVFIPPPPPTVSAKKIMKYTVEGHTFAVHLA